jgi:hypothetical protein
MFEARNLQPRLKNWLDWRLISPQLVRVYDCVHICSDGHQTLGVGGGTTHGM